MTFLSTEPGIRGAQVEVGLTNNFGVDYYVDHPILAINVGDTVKWTVQVDIPNMTQSYDSYWDSGLLTNVGASFSYTFTNAGVFPYRLLYYNAVVIVSDSRNEPPAITLNDPVEGLRLPSDRAGFSPLATVSVTETNVASVRFLSGTNVVATLTNAPYQFTWLGPSGDVTLTAQLVRKDGTTVSSRPAHFSVSGLGAVYNPRLLPGGEMMMFYATSSQYRNAYLEFKNNLPGASWAVVRPIALSFGVGVDTNAAMFSQRFYRVEWGELPPP